MNDTQTSRVLPDGSRITIHNPHKSHTYLAHIDLKAGGTYPAYGSQAKEIRRSEYIVVIKGLLNIRLNDVPFSLAESDVILIKDGDTFFIEAAEDTSLAVLVHDEDGGKTEIVESLA